MTQEEFLLKIAMHLETAGIPFMLTGSHGSSIHGTARTTADVDLVIDPTGEQLERFLTLLVDGFYVSPEAAREALQRRSMFNVIDLETAWKADLIVRKDRPFSLEEFARRQSRSLHGRRLAIATAEDVILSKLEWNKLMPSERQVRDALGVATIQLSTLDFVYLRKWATVLGISDALEDLLTQAGAQQ